MLSAIRCAGDQVILNDPFAGGTHLNDITLVAPCFLDGSLVGWAANRAHHADVGGAAPGSIPADATEIAQEGLRLPPVLLNAQVRAVLLANTRTPDERAGDLDAQVGANVLGVTRLAEIVASGAPLHEVADYAERRMRAALTDMPNGSWRATDVLDSTGPGQPPATIAVEVTIEGDTITFDFTGTDATRRQRERRRSGHRVVRRVRLAIGDRPDDSRKRRRAAPATRHRTAGNDRGRDPAGGGGRGQRRSEPTGRRRVPARSRRPSPIGLVPRHKGR